VLKAGVCDLSWHILIIPDLMETWMKRLCAALLVLGGLAAGTATLAVATRCAAKPSISPAANIAADFARLAALPAIVVPGQSVAVTVDYQAPTAGTILHVELKSAGRATIITSTTQQVRGRGQIIVKLAVPNQVAIGENINFATWLGTDWRHSLGPVYLSDAIKVQTAREADVLHQQALACQKRAAAFLAPFKSAIHNHRLIALYQTKSSWPAAIAGSLTTRLQTAGFTVARLSRRALANPALLNGRNLSALMLVNATTVPVTALTAIKHYVNSGGFLISLGGPAFLHLQYRSGHRWLSRAACRRRILSLVQTHLLAMPSLATKSASLSKTYGWQESSNTWRKPVTVQHLTNPRQLPLGVGAGYRFHFYLGGWCTFGGPSGPVTAGDKLTVFWAKGDKQAQHIAVEWDERDGSRWIAIAPLHTHWTRYVLPESAFHAWPHPRVKGRYFPGDHLHLRHGAFISFGLDGGITPEPGGRHYTIAIAGMGTGRLPAGRNALLAALQPRLQITPAVTTISPDYKLFPVTDMHTLTVNPRQAIAPMIALPTPASTFGLYPRAQATGLDKNMAARYVPLLNCLNSKGRFVAIAAALVLPSTAALPDSATTLSIPITDPRFFSALVVQRWLVDVIRRVHDGLYLAAGGTKEYAGFTGTAVPVGAVVVNRSSSPATVRVISTITNSNGKGVFRHLFTARMASGTMRKFAVTWNPPSPTYWESVFRVTTRLETGKALSTDRKSRRVMDRLVGSYRVLRVQRMRHFVTAKKGLFYLRGKPWYICGVNFWPESSMAQEHPGLFLNWCSRQSYDPQTVERNLRDVKKIGFNVISVAYDQPDDPWNLLDVLARARKLGLKVNLSIAGIDGLIGENGGPGKFDLYAVKHLIEKLHLASNNTLFAYDISWEPFWGTHANRRRLDNLWRRWIRRHYGSIQKAEAVWHCAAPREDGKVTNPFGTQIAAGHRGPAAAMVRAYNHFLNALLNHVYGSARRLIRSVDDHHLVSFRMSSAGDPGDPADQWYDFVGLNHVVDAFEPEGYGLMSVSPRISRRAVFTIAYARAINPNLPVFYAEFGHSQWDQLKGVDSPAAARDTAVIYRNFYKAILFAGGNGAICWWFPGGYRCGARSDYGIINPDRSWRPVTFVIHQYAPQIEKSRPLPTPTVWIPIHLNHVRAERGIYLNARAQFWAAYDAGKLPGLKCVP
jgi:hypothetical protein